MCSQTPVRTAPISAPATAPLPLEQMPGTTVATVKDLKGKVAAIGALVRYSNNQAYFVLQQIDPQLQDKAVVVSTPDIDEPLSLRIDQVQDELPFRSHLPMYVQVHHNAPERLILEHLVDNLAETTLGRQNLELKKNVTIDMFDSDNDAYIRDRAGFMVTDRVQFRELTVQCSEALSVIRADKNVIIEKFNAAELADLVDYDNTLSAQTRPDYLQFLASKCKIYVAKPRTPSTVEDEENEDEKAKLKIHGYMIVGANRVLGLYAKSSGVADALLATHIREARVKTVTFCTTRDQWRHVENLPHTKQRVIYRRHTRAVPSNVKWDRIFAVNVGMNLF